MYSKCFLIIRSEPPHKCGKSGIVCNINNHIKSNLTQKQKEQLAISLIKDSKSNKNDSILKLTQANAGNPLTINLQQPTVPDNPVISLEDICKIQMNYNLSNKTVRMESIITPRSLYMG